MSTLNRSEPEFTKISVSHLTDLEEAFTSLVTIQYFVFKVTDATYHLLQMQALTVFLQITHGMTAKLQKVAAETLQHTTRSDMNNLILMKKPVY